MTVVLQDGCSPLYVASCNGHLGVVKTLLKAGANINQVNKVGGHRCIFSTIVNMYGTCMYMIACSCLYSSGTCNDVILC